MAMTFREFLLIEADAKEPANKDKNMAVKKYLKDNEARREKDPYNETKRSKQSNKRLAKRLIGDNKDFPDTK